MEREISNSKTHFNRHLKASSCYTVETLSPGRSRTIIVKIFFSPFALSRAVFDSKMCQSAYMSLALVIYIGALPVHRFRQSDSETATLATFLEYENSHQIFFPSSFLISISRKIFIDIPPNVLRSATSKMDFMAQQISKRHHHQHHHHMQP